jgi:hypothetical protein
MSNKIEQIKELNAMLNQGHITPTEYEWLRAQVIGTTAMPHMGAIGRPFSIPKEPIVTCISFRNPVNGTTITVDKSSSFSLSLLFGCFYLAYKEVWLYAGIWLVLAFFTYGLSWFILPFFAYRIIVDSYRRKGWIEVPAMQGTRP